MSQNLGTKRKLEKNSGDREKRLKKRKNKIFKRNKGSKEKESESMNLNESDYE